MFGISWGRGIHVGGKWRVTGKIFCDSNGFGSFVGMTMMVPHGAEATLQASMYMCTYTVLQGGSAELPVGDTR